MVKKHLFLCLGAFLAFSFCRPEASLARDAYLAARENAMFYTLNFLQAERPSNRDKAARDKAMSEAIKEIEDRLPFGLSKEKVLNTLNDFFMRGHRYVNHQISFNDNLDEKTEKRSSLINWLTPGFRKDFRGQDHSIRLDTYLNNLFYTNRSSATSSGIETDIMGSFNLGRYLLAVSNDYFYNYRSAKSYVKDADDSRNKWKNTFLTTFGTSFNRFGFDAGYQRIDCDYKNAFSTNSYAQQQLKFSPYLRVANKSRVLFDYTHERNKYALSLSPARYTNTFNLGLNTLLSYKLNGLITSGFSMVDLKDTDTSDYRDTTMSGSVGYNISKFSNLSFSYTHTIRQAKTDINAYAQNGFILIADHRLSFNPKFKCSLSGAVNLTDYYKKSDIGDHRETYAYALDLSLDYAFREWLDFSLGWLGKRQESNSDDDYKNNIVSFTTQAKF